MLSDTEVIRYIEKKLGFKFKELELDSEEILENIRTDSLVTFSKYFPLQERLIINLESDLVPEYNNMYYLRTDHEIVNVNRIVPSSLFGANAITDLMHPTAAAMMYGDPISRQLDMDLMSSTKNPITFIFYPPNKVEITPVSSVIQNYIIICNVVHDNSFGTIPVNMQEHFLKLALYDTQDVLYHIRNRFTSIQTTFGNIEFFLSELEGANDNKKELLEEFKKSSILSPRRKKIIIA